MSSGVHRSSGLLTGSLAIRWAISILLLAGVAVLDTITGPELSFSIFYLIPVTFAAGLCSRRTGLIMALLSAAVWSYLDIKTGRSYSAPWIAYWNGAVRLGFFMVFTELVCRVRSAHSRERDLSRTDPLTGLANSRVFHERLNLKLTESRRSGRPFTLTYADLDRFKQLNDRWGHQEGDRILRVVARLMSEAARETDLVVRLGGDEFGILLPDTGSTEARIVLERLAESVASGPGASYGIGITLGAVTFLEPPSNPDTAVQMADELMYQGKSCGSGCIIQSVWPSSCDSGAEL